MSQGPGEEAPRRIIYGRQLEHFKVAIEDGDVKFLEGLERTGFRVEAADACHVLESLVVRSAREKIPDNAIRVVVRSTGRDWTCPNKGLILTEGKERLSFDRSLLDAALSSGLEDSNSIGVCNQAGTIERFRRLSALIDAHVSVHGMSDDFRQGVTGYFALINQLERTDRRSAVQACTALLSETADFQRYGVTRFVSGCQKLAKGEMRELIEARWTATADTQSIDKNAFVLEKFRELCVKWVPDDPWHINFADMKPTLASWASR